MMMSKDDDVYGPMPPAPEGASESHVPGTKPKMLERIQRALREHPETLGGIDLGDGRVMRVKTDGLGVMAPKDGAYGLDGDFHSPEGAMTPSTAKAHKPPTLVEIPAGTKAVACRGCKTVAVYFVGKQPIRVHTECVSRTTGNVYATPDAIAPTATTPGKGFNHFADCIAAGKFRA